MYRKQHFHDEWMGASIPAPILLGVGMTWLPLSEPAMVGILFGLLTYLTLSQFVFQSNEIAESPLESQG